MAEQLSREQIEIFAAGLYHLANVDGVSKEEHAQVASFLTKAGAADLIDKLPTLQFRPQEAAMILRSEWSRQAFFRAALDIVRADGVINEIERDAIRWLMGHLTTSLESVEELEANTASDAEP